MNTADPSVRYNLLLNIELELVVAMPVLSLKVLLRNRFTPRAGFIKISAEKRVSHAHFAADSVGPLKIEF